MQRIRPLGYTEPRTLQEASALLLKHEGAAIFAGGTDLIVSLRRKKPENVFLVNIKHIPGLSGVRRNADGGFDIGALTTVSELEYLNAPELGALTAASAGLGSRSVRNRATIGGNVGRASPASDLASPLIVLEAVAAVHGPDGTRSIPLSRFFLGPGKSDLRPGEILTSIHIPPQNGSRGWYAKRGRTCGCDCAQAGVAVQLHLDGDIIRKAKVALTAVAPVPLPAPLTEAVLDGGRVGPELFAQAAKQAVAEARPLTDFRSSADYRRVLVRSLTLQSLAAASRR